MTEDLQATFLEEARDIIEEIDEKLLILEMQPNAPDTLESLFRAFHTLKGSAGIVGWESIQTIAHRFEDILDGVRTGKHKVTTELINVLFGASDILKQVLDSGGASGTDWILAAEKLARHLEAGARDQVESQKRAAQTEASATSSLGLHLLPLAARLKLLEACLQGTPVVYVRLKCDQEIFQRGIDPLGLLVAAVETCGGSLMHLGLADGIPSREEFDPEKCYTPIEACIRTEVPIQELLAQLEFLQGDATITAGPVRVLDIFAPELPPAAIPAALKSEADKILQLLGSEEWPAETVQLARLLREVVALGTAVAARHAELAGGSVAEAVLLARLFQGCLEQAGELGPEELKRVSEDLRTLLTEYVALSGRERVFSLAPRSAAQDLLSFFQRDRYAGQPEMPDLDSAGENALAGETSRSSTAPVVAEHAGEETVRVQGSKIEKLLALAEELVIVKNSLVYCFSLIQDLLENEGHGRIIKEQLGALKRVTRELEETASSMRMVPIGQIFRRFNRFVRDTAVQLGKEASLVLEGAETELDRGLAQRLYEPLLHLVRNALDHGLETPEERCRLGKPGSGQIVLAAKVEGSNIVVSVKDDGRGIDVEKVKAKAVAQGLLTEEEAKSLSKEEALFLIFRPGLSTAEEVTDISGRGVGMDVVLSFAQSVGGEVHVNSVPQVGTEVRITLPLALTTSHVLLVRVGSLELGITIDEVARVISLSRSEIEHEGSFKLCSVGDQTLPVLPLAHVLGLSDAADENEEYRGLVLKSGVVVMVNKVVGDEDVVIRKLNGLIGDLPYYKGAALRGNGKVLMILEGQYLRRWLKRGF